MGIMYAVLWYNQLGKGHSTVLSKIFIMSK